MGISQVKDEFELLTFVLEVLVEAIFTLASNPVLTKIGYKYNIEITNSEISTAEIIIEIFKLLPPVFNL
jgi:hypothetical protein